MSKFVTIDETGWTNSGIAFTKNGLVYNFTHPDWAVPIPVNSDGSKIYLATDKSSQHRAIARSLGLDV